MTERVGYRPLTGHGYGHLAQSRQWPPLPGAAAAAGPSHRDGHAFPAAAVAGCHRRRGTGELGAQADVQVERCHEFLRWSRSQPRSRAPAA